jgi:tRNA/tmRNA/rRNA uracil-C5-methylase (TrmA/RlmC/RlmD family)
LVEAAVGGTEGRTAFDLYAGVGLFSLQLSRHFNQVHAIEGNHWRPRTGSEICGRTASGMFAMSRLQSRPG